MRIRTQVWTFFTALVVTMATCHAADSDAPSVQDLLKRAHELHRSGKTADALEVADKAIQKEPKNSQAYYVRGRLYEAAREHAKAIADFDHVLKLDPGAAQVYHLRGCEHFKLAHIDESLRDFDKFIQLVPRQTPQHWQRGIALYYGSRYEEGRLQFELHQTVNSNDVENAVWHFLCVAKKDGIEKARGSIIRITGDRRVPMAQIQSLFAGKGTAEQVLAIAQTASTDVAERRNDLFYAHLYLGLYYDATGDTKRMEEHISRAAGEFAQDHYMGDVARVHATLLRKRKEASASQEKPPSARPAQQ